MYNNPHDCCLKSNEVAILLDLDYKYYGHRSQWSGRWLDNLLYVYYNSHNCNVLLVPEI